MVLPKIWQARAPLLQVVEVDGPLGSRTRDLSPGSRSNPERVPSLHRTKPDVARLAAIWRQLRHSGGTTFTSQEF